MIKKKLFSFFTILILFLLIPSRLLSKESFWPIQSIDTMKYSRDRARELNIKEKIPLLVKKLTQLGINYIAVATPYDEEFYPILKTWVLESRKHQLKIWFRGNFSSWEGWFGYPKFVYPEEHHFKTYQFIISHPEIFQDGDIFTPAPEPENGGYGDPRNSQQQKEHFLNFLINSYNNCQEAFAKINKKIHCGYFSINGDIAKEVLNKKVVEKTGGVVVIDHYAKSAQRLRDDIEKLYQKYQAPVVLGEFGAPIPDIHGEMNENQQAQYLKDTLIEILKTKNVVKGVNYWTAYDASTSIFNNDFNPKLSFFIIQKFYQPIMIEGIVKDIFNLPIKDAQIFTNNFLETYSDKNGYFKLLTIDQLNQITIKKKYFIPLHYSFLSSKNRKRFVINLDYQNKNWIYYFKKIVYRILNKM
jgi:hypothetical protein